jgi:hypothetical protein
MLNARRTEINDRTTRTEFDLTDAGAGLA